MKHSDALKELAQAGVKYTRKDYMAGTVSHDEYYGQFVTEYVLTLLRDVIGEARIKASTDAHFNDIPLQRWDDLASLLSVRLVSLSNMSMQAGEESKPSVSLSDKVSILKAGARIIAGRGSRTTK